jgi:hypothetical protein
MEIVKLSDIMAIVKHSPKFQVRSVRLRFVAEQPSLVMLNNVKHLGHDCSQRWLSRLAQILRGRSGPAMTREEIVTVAAL